MSSNLRCQSDCPRTFSSKRGLTQHRSSCDIYRRAQADVIAWANSFLLTDEPPTKQVRMAVEEVQVGDANSWEAYNSLRFQADRQCDPLGLSSVGASTQVSKVTSPISLGLSDASPQTTPDVPIVASSEQSIPLPPPLPAAPAESSTQTCFDPPVIASSEHSLPPRNRRLPARYRDLLPEPPLPAVDHQTPSSSTSVISRVILHVWDSFTTLFNKFGIARAYRHRPSYDPDAFLSIEELSQRNEPIGKLDSPQGVRCDYSPPWPWSTMSVWHLMNWKNSGGIQKTNAEVTRLVCDVLKAPDFKIVDLSTFDASRETARFDAAEREIPPEDPFGIDRWKHTSIDISVPTREKRKEGNSVVFAVDGLRYRPILDVVRAVFAQASSRKFHFTPFKRLWKSPLTGREQRVYDELYASDAWNQAHDEIMKQRRGDGCKLERVVAGLMLWSDSTQLAQFGHASAWPIYLFFGNLSKYA